MIFLFPQRLMKKYMIMLSCQQKVTNYVFVMFVSRGCTWPAPTQTQWLPRIQTPSLLMQVMVWSGWLGLSWLWSSSSASLLLSSFTKSEWDELHKKQMSSLQSLQWLRPLVTSSKCQSSFDSLRGWDWIYSMFFFQNVNSFHEKRQWFSKLFSLPLCATETILNIK